MGSCEGGGGLLIRGGGGTNLGDEPVILWHD